MAKDKYPFIHNFATGNWKQDMFCEEVEEDKHYQMIVDFECVDGSVQVHGADSEMVVNTARLLSAVPEMVQCVEMFHDFLISKGDSIALDVVKETLRKAGILNED